MHYCIISPLFSARKHISKQRKNTQNNFPSNPWYDKECKSLKYVVNNIAKQRDFNARHGEYNIMLRQYKQLIQRKKRQYQQAKLSEPGVDGISAEFYKYGCNELLPALESLFNTILTNGEYPSRWATGIIHPVYKKGEHGVPDNYRKITVMPCIGKLFESIFNNRLSFKNEVCNDNDPYQAGFKSNSRTTDNIFILCAIIDKQRCFSKPLYTCFVDFTQAFDYIDRTALYYKLLNRGIDGNLLNIIRSMFSKAECRVKWDSRISDILKSEYGVLQGGMLSPKLFTEFLQDISATFEQDQGIPVDTLLMVYLLFADDLVLFSESAEGLQKQLTALYLYASLWHIIVSIPKTKVLIFNERYTKVHGSFHYGDNIIEKSEQYKYLGVVYSTKSANNMLKETFSHLASQAGKAIFALRKQSRPVVGKLSPTIAFKAFDCQILPILEYGSDIWYTGDDVNDLEKIHLKFFKSTLGVRKQTPTPAIYGDTGRFPLIIRQHIKAVKYWCIILKLSQSHPVRNAYNMLVELNGIGFTNWCSRIRSVLERAGLDQIWESQNIGDTNEFMLLFKESIVRIFTQQWRKDIESSSKLRTYALVKKYFCVEPYILHTRGNHLITSMARYRMSSHDLLLHAMNNERNILFNSVTATINIQPTNEMFLQIMTSRDITVVKSLAQFIYGCFKQINC